MQARKLSWLPDRPFCLSLHLRHPSLDPAQISRELGCDPDEAFGAGNPRKSRSGAAAASVHSETYWVATLDPTFWRSDVRLHTSRQTTTTFVSSLPDARAKMQSVPGELTSRRARVLPMRTGGETGRGSGSSEGSEGEWPADPPSRFRLLVALGREQGYLTEAQLNACLPDETCDPVERDDLVKRLAELAIPVHLQSSRAMTALQRSAVLTTGFWWRPPAASPAQPLAEALHFLCMRFWLRHRAFFTRLREEGGSARLLVTVSQEAVHGLSVRPDLSARLAQLGIHLELALAGLSPAQGLTPDES